GSQADFVITYRNIGTTIASGTYSFKYDAGMSFISSDSVSVTHTGDSIVFNYTNLRPFESRKNQLTFDLATTLTFEDTLLIKAEILPLLNDSNINNNFYELPLIIRAAFDPNQKTVLPVESLNLLEAQSGSREIEYTLQFQNTGNDTAFHVIVTDSLEAGLDIS